MTNLNLNEILLNKGIQTLNCIGDYNLPYEIKVKVHKLLRYGEYCKKLNIVETHEYINELITLSPDEYEHYEYDPTLFNNPKNYPDKLGLRLHKDYYQKTGKNINPLVKSLVVNWITEYKPEIMPIYYDIVNEFNWDEQDFNQGSSCFWYDKSRSANRECMELSGLFYAIRFFDRHDGNISDGIGRAWLYSSSGVMDSNNPVIVFNAYGDYKLERIARIVSTLMYGNESNVHRIDLYSDDSRLYVNGSNSYAIYGNSIPSYYTIDSDFYNLQYTSQFKGKYKVKHRCAYCDHTIDEHELIPHDGNYYHENCFHDNFSECHYCRDFHLNDQIRYIESEDISVCRHHYRQYGYCECEVCYEHTQNWEMINYVCTCENCQESEESTESNN